MFLFILTFLSCSVPSIYSQQLSPLRPCADDTNFRCHWVDKKNTNKRCRKAATDGTTYADHCPLTCQTCTAWMQDVIAVSSFGAVGDGFTDDTLAIQSAIDYAHGDFSNATKAGGVVTFGRGVYRTYAPIVVPDGVRLMGEGYGESPLQIKFGGSVLAYCGEGYAVVIRGHNAGIERMAVYDWNYGEERDCSTIKAAGGILVDADGRLVESVVVRDVLIYHFMNGTSVTLRARNKGGVAYGSFNDLRVRHAKVGIHLLAEDGSFVNHNHFHGGVISGRMVESGLIAEGPGPCNSNTFNNMAIEPPNTRDGHIIVRGSKTNVRMVGVRLEGTKQDPLIPMVSIADGSYNNVLEGMIGHTFVSADFNLNPDVTFLTYKGTSVRPNSENAFRNTAFHGVSFVNETVMIPDWKLSGDGATSTSIVLSPSSEELFPNHRVLNLTLPSTSSHVTFLPSSNSHIPVVHKTCSFGIYARTSVPRGIVATMRSKNGMVTSTGHSGSGNWEFIGQSGPFRDPSAGGPSPTFYIYSNVELSAPTLSFGTIPPTSGFDPIGASGGKMTGTLSLGMAVVPPPTNYFWELPHEGNLFQMELDVGEVTIHRINGASGNQRFPVGTVITILLPEVGVTFTPSGYLLLKGNTQFRPTLPNSSLTLVCVSSTNTWKEVNRND